MAKFGKTWLILGSGISAREMYAVARPLADVVCTANGGLAIEPRPDHYWLTDSKAARDFLPQAQTAIASGTNLITARHAIRRSPHLRPLAIAGTILDYDITHRMEWTPGQYSNCRTSGGLLTQYAVNHGARRILLVGMTGYTSGGGVQRPDYFDGRPGSPTHDSTMAFYGPCLQSVFDLCPGIRFTFYGKPNYPWAGTNVDVVEAPAPAPVERALEGSSEPLTVNTEN